MQQTPALQFRMPPSNDQDVTDVQAQLLGGFCFGALTATTLGVVTHAARLP